MPTENMRVIMQSALDQLNRDAVNTLEMGMLRSAFLLSRDRPRRQRVNSAIIQMMQQAARATSGSPPLQNGAAQASQARPAPPPAPAPPASEPTLQELGRQVNEDLSAILELAQRGPEAERATELCQRFLRNTHELQKRMRAKG